MPSEFSQLLLQWYAHAARALPWRERSDAYSILVSEIMLQQTRVETTIPYFQRWLERFPTLAGLAAAPEQEVLRLWEGLGYYSRARNLHRTARQVVVEYNGVIPSSAAELERLPGVGRYTAAAVASIAFGKDEAALDGNIRRVLARYFNIELSVGSPQAEKVFWGLAREHLPRGRASDYNQALMDLGATVCTPCAPRCEACPLEALCQARILGVQEARPVRRPRATIPHYIVTAAVIRRSGRVLIAQRPSTGLLGGLWEFPGGKQEPGESLVDCMTREIREELGAAVHVGVALGVYQHAYTHFRITLHAFACTLLEKQEPQALHASEIRWVAPEELGDFPMGKVDRQISRSLVNRTEAKK
ncbi:MAG: A/G-specific adenine glycosylase [Anaerolineaceae bacterium]|nr:A/G-specific adenine glycosylase [Anaerolineaceae bacterium]